MRVTNIYGFILSHTAEEISAQLAADGKLVVAGPFADGGDKRGLFIFNVTTIDEAKALVETDPVITSGMMVYELTKWYGSAALPELAPIEKRIAKKNF